MADQHSNAHARAQHPLPRAGVTHIRHRHTERFTVVGNHLAQHRELSLTAIGLAVHIQSLPDGAVVSIKCLTSRFREGEVAIARALRELERCGYLARVRERTSAGRCITRTVSYDKPPCAAAPEPAPAPVREPAPTPEPDPVPVSPPATALLASLRGRDPRLLLGEHDIRRLAPAAAAWFARGVPPEDAARTLAADLPAGVIRRPAALLSYRLTHWLPPALPPADNHPRPVQLPPPLQTCDGCERAFRAPEAGRCRDCRRKVPHSFPALRRMYERHAGGGE
ncbi:helix-turn-helix domain-containing protein [Streptomyces sp. ODS28]|uniref:helix-turn-helix domain-containing protein n=1 Tax=Streptomyces sp. ODS28 TaxID=3136688 RepID=UPI0031EB2693